MRNALLLLLFAIFAGSCGKFGQSASALTGTAQSHFAKGEFTTALVHLKNALRQEPDHVEANALIGITHARIGELGDAERKIRRALELGAPKARLLPELGQALIDSEQYQKAIDELRAAKDLDADTTAQITLLIARAHLGLDQLTEARKHYRLAEKSKPADARLGLAQVAAEAGDRDTAYRLTNALIAETPANDRAWLMKGDLLRGDAKPQDALAAYLKALELAPANIMARLSLAATYAGLNEHDKARAELDQVKKAAPANPILHFMLAQNALRERKFDQCSDHLQVVLRLIPQHMPSILLSGSLFFATERLEQAQISFTTYLSRHPNNVHARKMLAATLLRKNQPHIAVRLLDPLLPYVKDDAELFGIAGEAYMQIGQHNKARDHLAKAVSLAPQNAEVRTRLGFTHLVTGNVSQGITELESAIALNPDDSRPEHLLMKTLVTQNKIEKAREVMQGLEKRRPDKPDTYFLKGALARSQQQWADARANFEHALKLQATFFPAAASLAQLDLQDKKPDAARGRMSALLKLDARNLDAMLLLAQMDIDVKNHADALGWLRKAVADHPQSIQALLMLAQTHLQSGRPSEAVTIAQQARTVAPKDETALEILGNAQLASGNIDAAISNFILLADALPDSSQAQLKLVSAYHAKGNYRDANTIIRRLLKRTPQDLDTKAALIENLLHTKAYREAVELTQQMQKQDPKRAQGFTLEGEIAMAQQDYARAVTAYERADALQPNGLLRVRLHQAQIPLGKSGAAEKKLNDWVKAHPADIAPRFYLAEVENKAGRYRTAAEHYKAALKQEPNDYRLLNNLAWVLLNDGDPKALDYAQQAFNLKPGDATVADTLGWIYVKQGKVEEGMQILNKAVTLNADNPQIRYHLAQAYLQAGDKSRARSELRMALATKRKFEQLDEARSQLRSLEP